MIGGNSEEGFFDSLVGEGFASGHILDLGRDRGEDRMSGVTEVVVVE